MAGDIGFYSIEKRFIRKDGRVIWIAVRSSTVRDATGHFLYGVRVVQDVTERKEAEERQKLLIDELNHRVKNTLATVQSLATQTARGTDSPDAFRKAFEGRLIALSQAHDQLTRRHWKSADLRDIVEGATAPHLARSHEAQDQIAIEGEPITVTPRVALTLALGLHELTTNATKYGALSVPAGRIEVRWRIERQPSQAAAVVDRMARARRTAGGGAGAAGLRHALHRGQRRERAAGRGAAGLRPAPGLVCTMEIPLDAVTPDVDGHAVERHATAAAVVEHDDVLGLGEEQPALDQHAGAGAERRQRGDGDLQRHAADRAAAAAPPRAAAGTAAAIDKRRSFPACRRATW